MKEILIPDELHAKLLIESEKRKISIEKLIADIIEEHYNNSAHLNFVIENELENKNK